MKTNFPTIREMENAILFAMGDGKVHYQQETMSFLAIEMIPYPVRDDGGSIDSIDFEKVEHTISFQEGYQYWVAMNDFFNGMETPLPAPICPRLAYPEFEFDDLPF